MSRWEIIKELVGLRAKLYSYKVFEGKEEKKCKSVKKPFVKRSIKFDVPTPTHEFFDCQRKWVRIDTEFNG